MQLFSFLSGIHLSFFMKNVFTAFMCKLNKVFAKKTLEFLEIDLENVSSKLNLIQRNLKAFMKIMMEAFVHI